MTAASVVPARFVRLTPALPVPDARAAAEYYRDRLGFTILDLFDHFAILDRNGLKLQFWRGEARGSLALRDKNPGLRDLNIAVENVDAAHAEFVARGLPVLEEPEDFSYGTRHAVYHDLNGYVILTSGPVNGITS